MCVMFESFNVFITLNLFDQELGLTFASVHDSYWTHACDIDTMSSVIRDTFIALHSSDVLGKLREEARFSFHLPLLV